MIVCAECRDATWLEVIDTSRRLIDQNNRRILETKERYQCRECGTDGGYGQRYDLASQELVDDDTVGDMLQVNPFAELPTTLTGGEPTDD